MEEEPWANTGVLQNEYASILAKRVNEEKAKKSELRSKWHLHQQIKDLWLTRKQSEGRHQ